MLRDIPRMRGGRIPLHRAHIAGIFFREYSAAAHYKAAGDGFAQRCDGAPHAGYGCGHERGKADEARSVRNGRFHNRPRRHILSKVNHIISVVFEKNFYNVLSDVVYITFDRCDNDRCFFLLCFSVTLHILPDRLEPCLGCFCTH